MNPSCSVVVLAAGQGTRMKSAIPKVLQQICGRSLLGHALKAAEGTDPTAIIVVVRHEKELVSVEAKSVCPSAFVAEQDAIAGTGRAVHCALEAAKEQNIGLSDTIVVTSGDVPLLTAETLRQLVAAHQSGKAAVTVMTTVVTDPTGYGRIIRLGDAGKVDSIVEQKDASAAELAVNEINAGIYAFDGGFLRGALEKVDLNNSQGEMYLTDTVKIAVAQGLDAQAFILEDQWQAEGCNDLVQLATLRKVLTRRLLENHMRSGVSVIDPDSTGIDVDVTIAADAVIHPCSQLGGSTLIGTGAQIGPCTTLDNAGIGALSIVSHCVIRDANVAIGEHVQPFTVRQGLTPGV